MHFVGTTPEQIYTWIQNKENGDSTDYVNGKDDTQDAIDVFRKLYNQTFDNVENLFSELKDSLRLRVSQNNSLYRSFIVLSNDMIITLRLSEHYSTKTSTSQAAERNGKPDIEYHLVIGAKIPNNSKKYIRKDRSFNGIEIKVMDIDLEDFNDAKTRQQIINEIVCLLSYGTTNETTIPKENEQNDTSVDAGGNHQSSHEHGADYVSESKNIYKYKQNNCNRNMNRNSKNVVRLTESKLKQMIAESVSQILTEKERYSTTSSRIPTTDEDFCWLIFERTFKAVGQIGELVSELDQLMPKSMKKRFSQIIKEIKKSYDTIEKARLLTDRIRNEIEFGPEEEPYYGGSDAYERGQENRGWT